MQHIHMRQIVHCDIKTRNILVTTSGSLQLADFGSAGQVNEMRSAREVYTYPYRAHECVCNPDRRVALTYAMDVWAAAVCLFEMLLREPDGSVYLTSGVIDSSGSYCKSWNLPKFRELIPARCRKRCNDYEPLINMLLQCIVEPVERPSVTDLCVLLSS